MKIVNQAKLTINEINFADSTFTSFGTSSSSGSMVLRGRGRMWCSKSRLLELRSNFPLMQIKKIITRIRCKNFIVLKRLVLSVSGCRLKWDHQGPYKSHWCKGCKNRRIYFALKISKQLRYVQCTYPVLVLSRLLAYMYFIQFMRFWISFIWICSCLFCWYWSRLLGIRHGILIRIVTKNRIRIHSFLSIV